MDLYRCLHWFGRLRSPRLKLAGLWMLHVCGRRYLAVHLDPVLACNFRCRMCYFSDEGRRRTMRGTIAAEDVPRVARSLFHRTLKLQIGCGAEPTLYPHLEEVVGWGSRCRVPYISLTTNGQLLTYGKLRGLVDAGLNELTLSVHGLCQATYESMMPPGRFSDFCHLLGEVARVKEECPAFRFRVNYTVNEDNVEELVLFWTVFAKALPHVLQVRPVQQIGQTDYCNFSLKKVEACYDSVLVPLQEECLRRGITFIGPARENLAALENNSEDENKEVEDLIYCYASPKGVWQPDFDFRTDTFESYSRRTNRAIRMFRRIFGRLNKTVDTRKRTTRKMNYVVR
ncbi:MAG: radical SAM protein [Paraprevotella sp.]|nr:radical SAM protein [Paraprevotella sp.]